MQMASRFRTSFFQLGLTGHFCETDIFFQMFRLAVCPCMITLARSCFAATERNASLAPGEPWDRPAIAKSLLEAQLPSAAGDTYQGP